MTELEPFVRELVPFPVTDRLPGLPPPDVAALGLLDAFRQAVARERSGRGEVTEAADTFTMVLAVEGFRDLTLSYSKSLKRVSDDAAAVLAEELIEVHGEQDGIPQGRLWVPDADGTVVTVKPDVDHIYDIDQRQILAVIALWMSAKWQDDPERPEPAQAPEEFAVAVALRLIETLGATAKVKVTQVRKLVADLAADGETSLAETADGAIRATDKFKGVTVARLTEDQQQRARSRKKAS